MSIALGILFFQQKQHYKKMGKMKKARIIGYLRKKQRGNNSHSGGVTFHPIVEYTFNGGTVLLRGGGSNMLPYGIGEEVELLTLPHGPEYAILKGEKAPFVVTALLTLMGLAFNDVFYFVEDWSFQLRAGFVIFNTILPLALLDFFKKKSIKNNKPLWLKGGTVYTYEELQSKNVLWENQDLRPHKEMIQKSGNIITFIFTFISFSSAMMLWNKLEQNHKEFILKSFKDFQNLKDIEVLLKEKDPVFLGFLIAFFFSLMCIYSITRSFLKLKK